MPPPEIAYLDKPRLRMSQLQNYIGRIVRLNARAFKELAARAQRRGAALENCFIVAQVKHRARKLVCYGANLRITVCASDVVLV